MAESITYGTYTFPYPTPLVAEGVEPIYIQGEVDHIKFIVCHFLYSVIPQ